MFSTSNLDVEKQSDTNNNGFKRRNKPRLVAKDGTTLFKNLNLPRKRITAIRNWFHLAIEFQWRYILLIYVFLVFGSWICFALVYFIITKCHKATNDADLCIANVDSFITALLFSVETQATIGYGNKYMTNLCPVAYITFFIQVLFGHILITALGAFIIAKILRPKKRRQEIRFSRLAVVGPVDENDKRPCIMVRIADVQENLFLADAHVKMYLAKTKINQRGQKEMVGIRDIDVGYNIGLDRTPVLWPVIVRHIIDEKSPFHKLTNHQLQSSEFELIMTLEGIVEATGMTFQARASFLPDEILWGHRFKPMIILNELKLTFEVHHELFDETERLPGFESNLLDIESTNEMNPNNKSGFW